MSINVGGGIQTQTMLINWAVFKINICVVKLKKDNAPLKKNSRSATGI